MIVLEATSVFQNNWESTKKININRGGSRSGKTYNLLQLFFFWLLYGKIDNDKYFETGILTIVRKYASTLKGTCMRDFEEIIDKYNSRGLIDINKSNKTYTYKSRVIEFIGADDQQKLRGGKRDILYCNEANELEYRAEFFQLLIRATYKVFIDFNPDNEDIWINRELEQKRRLEDKDVRVIVSTYQDNPFLGENQVKELERLRDIDPQYWQIYGLGQYGKLEGLIFNNFSTIKEVPQEAKILGYGLDFGFSCLVGETLIKTINGEKRIDEVKEGDYVLTRQGYKKVLWQGSRGKKKVYSFNFGLGMNIISTGDHIFYTKNGWKEAQDLNNNETICCLKKLSFNEELTQDIKTENIKTTFFIKQEKKIGDCIGIFTLIILEKFQKVMQFIILIIIHLIIAPIILLLYLIQIIQKFIIKKNCDEFQKKEWEKLELNIDIQKITGEKEEKRVLKQLEKELINVLNVVKKYSQGMSSKNIVEVYVGKKPIQEVTKKNINAKIVEGNFLHQVISNEHYILKNVKVLCHQIKEEREVFDLTIEGVPEFFANGVLVHNCDPTALIGLYQFNQEIILDEMIFQNGLTNQDLAKLFQELGVIKNIEIIADSSEPKSIEEIYRYGFNIKPAEKGPDSIMFGIDLMKQYMIRITEKSFNLLKEFKKYCYKTDKNGKLVSPVRPIDIDNHGIDASRYIITSKLKKQPKRTFYQKF